MIDAGLQRKGLIAFLFIFFTFSAFSQIDEGRVLYDVTYPGAELDSLQLASLPHESMVWFKKHLVRIDLQSGKGITNCVIINNKKQEADVLMDMNGDKTCVHMDKKAIEAQNRMPGDAGFKITGAKKMIAGYDCLEAVSTSADGKNLVVWFTDQISSPGMNWNKRFRDLDGFLMEFTAKEGQLNMQMTARNVEAVQVPDSVFVIPAGYVTISEAEFKGSRKAR